MKIKNVSIAVDGPAGAGKSTLSRMLAARFGYVYIDTGSLYRSVALYMTRKKVASGDKAGVVRLLPEIRLEIKPSAEGQRVFLNGEDVTGKLHSPEISFATSEVSAIPQVRDFMLMIERKMAESGDVVMDGRDIGTVVLPHATLKLFLTASPEDRARRRYEEMTGRGEKTEYKKVLKEMVARDAQDSSRKVAPLRPADDALIVDTTGFPLEKSLERLSGIIKEHIK